jgi:hypothetical protein
VARKAELARKFLNRGMQVPDARGKLPAVRKLLLEIYKLGAGIGKNITIISTFIQNNFADKLRKNN